MPEVTVQFAILPRQNISFLECLHKLSERFDISPRPVIHDVHVPRLEGTIGFSDAFFEPGNISQHITVFEQFLDPAFVQDATLLMIHWPKNLLMAFKGPEYGMSRFRNMMKIPERPLSAATISPSLGMSVKDSLETAYYVLSSGIDIVIDGEMTTSLSSTMFDERIEFLSKEGKRYIPNITAKTVFEMERRAMKARDKSIATVMVNGTGLGFSELNSLRQIAEELELFVFLQRNENTFSINSRFRVGNCCFRKIIRLIGMDLLTVFVLDKTNFREEIQWLSDEHVFHAFHPVVPVFFPISRKEIPSLIKSYGHNIMLQTTTRLIEDDADTIKEGAREFQKSLDAAFRGIE